MTTLLNVLSERLIPHLWAVSWQVSILFAIVWIVEKLSFRASSLFKYWLWMIVLIRLCIPLNLAIPGGLGQRIMDSIGFSAPAVQDVTVNTDNTPGIGFREITSGETGGINGAVISREPVTRTPHYTAAGIVGMLWLAILSVIGAVVLYRILWIKRRLRQYNPVGRVAAVEDLSGSNTHDEFGARDGRTKSV